MEDNFRPSQTSHGYLMDIIKSVAVALIITFVILLAASLLLCFTDFPEKYTLPSAIAGTVLGVFFGSTMAAKKNPLKHIVSGILTAFVYAVIAFIIGCILQGKVSFTMNTALFGVIALLTGAIASILANRQKSTRKFGKGTSSLADRFKRGSTKSYNLGKSGRL
ncbi:MAG: TIGR04086 family membrane protein [Clostridia bacterium]|nr:TIGR04086 family membrane protein [Clostridia bacterium]